MTSNSLPTDALLHASAADAGRAEIEEYLRCSGDAPGKRCFKRILKRIRRSELYKDGKFTVKARTLAVVLLSLLALAFAVLGFCSARLLDSIFTAKDIGQYFAVTNNDGTAPVLPYIEKFLEPQISDGYQKSILIRSSRLYNVEFRGKDDSIYYTQTPKGNGDETANDSTDTNGLYALVNGNKAKITVTNTDSGSKSFEICWSDDTCTYRIFGARSMEYAVSLAQSVYDNKEDTSTTEEKPERK